MKIKLGEKEFEVKSLIDNFGKLEIEFSEGTTYEEVAAVYDPIKETFSKELLRSMTVYNDEDELQGVHLGYTEPHSIFVMNGVIKVVINKEDEMRTELEELKKQNAFLTESLERIAIQLNVQ